MRIIFMVTIFLLIIGCKNKTHTLTASDGSKIKVILPDSVVLSTDSVHINYVDRLLINEINWEITGTEPFWHISIFEDSVTYSILKEKMIEEKFVISALVTDIDNINTYTYILENSNKVNITIKKEICSDGMSDHTYPYSATFNYKGMELKGCAEKK